jgi:hypothetical protein
MITRRKESSGGGRCGAKCSRRWIINASDRLVHLCISKEGSQQRQSSPSGSKANRNQPKTGDFLLRSVTCVCLTNHRFRCRCSAAFSSVDMIDLSINWGFVGGPKRSKNRAPQSSPSHANGASHAMSSSPLWRSRQRCFCFPIGAFHDDKGSSRLIYLIDRLGSCFCLPPVGIGLYYSESDHSRCILCSYFYVRFDLIVSLR